MTPEEKDLLHRVAVTVEENNKILHSLRNAARWNTFWRWIYWIVIIGTAIGAFWFIQPYLDKISGGYASFANGLQELKNLPSGQQ